MELLILIGLILLNGVFAMSELAVVSSRRARLQARADKGDLGAKAALKLQDDPSKFLSTVQIGITLIGIIAGAYGATALADDIAPSIAALLPSLAVQAPQIAFGVVIVLTTFLSLVVGELVPKRIAMLAPEGIATAIAPPMTLLATVAAPVVWVLRATTDGLLKVLGLGGQRKEDVTEEEIHAILEEGASSGAIEHEEREMMRGVMRLADRDVASIMTPRPEVVWLDLNRPAAELLTLMADSGHSRFPVARGDLQEVIGVVQSKTLLARSGCVEMPDIEAAATPAPFVPGTLPVTKLLEAMQGSEVRLALVIDEHGVIEGVVTGTDLLGAIAGAKAFSPDDGLDPAQQRADGSWLIDGMTPISELETLLEVTNLDEDMAGYSTVAGLVMHHLQRLPTLGDSVSLGTWRFEVIDMDGRRVDKVLVSEASGEREG
jgi:putative hemolysin